MPLGVLAVIAGSVLLTTPAPMKSTRRAALLTIRTRRWRLQHSNVTIVALFFFVYVALEVGFANWIHSYVEQIGYGDGRHHNQRDRDLLGGASSRSAG